MTRYDRRSIALAICLAALAGYVDAIGFLELDGVFVSFMSGNSTRLGIFLARAGLDGTGAAAPLARAALVGGIIATFVCGVVVGTLVGDGAGRHRRRNVLALEAALLATAAGAGALGQPIPAILGMVLAMGGENAVFQRDGDVAIGLTYMTGTLVKLGQRLAMAMQGGPPWAFVPYALLWSGLTTGAALGSAAYRLLGLEALWAAAAFCAALAAATALTPDRSPARTVP